MDTARDVMIIVLSVIGTAFFAILIVMLIWVSLSVRGLIREVKGLVDDEVKPTLRSVREGVNSMRGAAATAGSVGGQAMGGNTFRAFGLAMEARRLFGMMRNRVK